MVREDSGNVVDLRIGGTSLGAKNVQGGGPGVCLQTSGCQYSDRLQLMPGGAGQSRIKQVMMGGVRRMKDTRRGECVPGEPKSQDGQHGVAAQLHPPGVAIGFAPAGEELTAYLQQEVFNANSTQLLPGKVEGISFTDGRKVQVESLLVMGQSPP